MLFEPGHVFLDQGQLEHVDSGLFRCPDLDFQPKFFPGENGIRQSGSFPIVKIAPLAGQ